MSRETIDSEDLVNFEASADDYLYVGSNLVIKGGCSLILNDKNSIKFEEGGMLYLLPGSMIGVSSLDAYRMPDKMVTLGCVEDVLCYVVDETY